MRQEAAWNRGDIAAFMSGYWKSPDVRFLSGDKIVSGWNETHARYRAKYATRAQMGTLGFTDLRVDMLAPTRRSSSADGGSSAQAIGRTASSR